MARGKRGQSLFSGRPSEREGALIPTLQGLQEAQRHLPPGELAEISERLGIPLSRVFSVATFFSQFSLTPRGKHLIRVCLGTACHVRGAPQVLEELIRFLGVGEDGLTPDREVMLQPVRCLGACALAPVVVAVDGRYHGGMTPTKAKALLDDLRGRKDD